MTAIITLGEVATRIEYLDVACPACDPRGLLSIARLLAEHGPARSMPVLLDQLTADCPRRAGRLNRCQAQFPQLPTLF